MKNISTSLKLLNGKSIIYDDDSIRSLKDSIFSFISSELYMNNIKFAKKMMMSQEIKSNNLIEGISDDLSLIDSVIKNKKTLSDTERNRIINLYHGYQYILNNNVINKDTLKQLYSKLSYKLLDSYSLNNMGEYYRQKAVYIYEKNRYDAYPATGIDEKYVEYYMDKLLEYLNSNSNDSSIECFIKSQVIHFYFVYIHPYFDINGRTGRTTSMWYLLNNEAYPYIIFNRAIAFNQSKYEPCIIYTKETGNITLFLKYILYNVLYEFENEYVIHSIEKLSDHKLTLDNLQTLEYILCMNGNITAKDFCSIYNKYNDNRRPNIIIDDKLVPLIEKNIIIPTSYTKKHITGDDYNYYFTINDKYIDIDKSKLKRLDISKYAKKGLN